MEERVLLGVQKKKPIKQSKKRFLKKVVDYLKSDTYMYAPLISPPNSISSASRTVCSSPPSGPLWYLKKVTAASSTTKITRKKNNQPTEQPSNVIGEEGPSKGICLGTSTVDQQTPRRREIAKHMVPQKCRPSPMPRHSVCAATASLLDDLVAAKSL